MTYETCTHRQIALWLHPSHTFRISLTHSLFSLTHSFTLPFCSLSLFLFLALSHTHCDTHTHTNSYARTHTYIHTHTLTYTQDCCQSKPIVASHCTRAFNETRIWPCAINFRDPLDFLQLIRELVKENWKIYWRIWKTEKDRGREVYLATKSILSKSQALARMSRESLYAKSLHTTCLQK